LDEIELEIAERSEPADGAAELLESLLSQGAKIGILTRNNAINIQVSLKAAGLLHYFAETDLLSRECAAPKPAPDGIHKLLNNWQASIDDAVMVGDSIHDLDAGRNAKAATIYFDTSGEFAHKNAADLCVTHLSELIL
jgi:HAD superfamily hydrolase (TIGR01549 family)